MTMLYVELAEKLQQLDEITLMELLEISSEDLVAAFPDKIEDNFDKLLEAIE